MASAASPPPPTAEERRFEAPVGSIVGFVDGEVVRVLGVAYATAARFERPRAVPRVRAGSEPYRAFQRSPASPQISSPVLEKLLEGANDGMTFSEDCLNLSVTLPADVGDDERLPVMVWIHGGSYVTGGGDLDFYEPRALVSEQRVIVVAVTYRLGMLGYFGDGRSIPANLGLLDQLEALRWIQDNIGAFGGAADDVTLFGQSAGGDAILHLMISEGSTGLFHRAIVQSAPLGIISKRSRMESAMVEAVGEPPRTGPVSEVLALQAVAERAARRFGLAGGMPFASRYDCPPLPAESRREAAWSAIAPSVDVLIGSLIDETALYLAVMPSLLRSTRTPVIGRLIRFAIVRPTTWVVYSRGARRFVARHRRAGGRATLYRLTWAPKSSPIGAGHIGDLPLLLGSREAWTGTPLVGTEDWDEVESRGRTLRRIWADFARTGAVAREHDGNGILTFERGRGA